jgi:hypothetical protein
LYALTFNRITQKMNHRAKAGFQAHFNRSVSEATQKAMADTVQLESKLQIIEMESADKKTRQLAATAVTSTDVHVPHKNKAGRSRYRDKVLCQTSTVKGECDGIDNLSFE